MLEAHSCRRRRPVKSLVQQTEVLRDNLQREVEVTARLQGVDLGTGIAAVQKAIADLKMPPSVRVVYGGTCQEQQKSFSDLATVLVLAVVLIFLVLTVELTERDRSGVQQQVRERRRRHIPRGDLSTIHRDIRRAMTTH